ncbi:MULTISPECIES: DUF6531 domain-containing protein [Streptomycetaceae]|uniref:YD repeat protein n=1 Tax=Streptantibioticus cattleyicolor (strain ATCC 35852 / DSM 46488 / JCM 4925 / NBRC 14057 / NRRL 8057) TaxID=1003195 RepID=F8K562_STREN|nr:DUF6531 domain-containing protein [Streptantibioticus cattleyicolor]AEW96675.1 YD repeat protein [Streptantibioticus cattleyicolor NRRL 8057 = DSM 46488]MYS61167.1 type IV secretion protein Rhs [Streptomyces sp. SID5468]CCB77014.1 Rhs family protein [Streptantibioticus cattleyicolor NRRL 8057 = DSM 46488]
MSDIVNKLVKPTVEFLDHLARKVPQALGKGHHRIAQHIHKAADHFDKVEADLAAKAKSHHPHEAHPHIPEATAGAGAAAAAGAKGAEKRAAENAGRGMRPHDGAKESVPGSEKTCKNDPVDVATGDMVMAAVDVELPGALPLVLERTHISSYRHGLWFGPSWISTLDQRLQLDADGVVFATADGMRLEYPPPRGDAPVLPVRGPRRPLSWDGAPNAPMSVADPRTGEALVFDHPRPAPDVIGGVVLRLTAIEDRNGRRIDITYADDDTPALITHHGGYRIAVDRHPDLPRITALRLLDTDGPGTDTTLVRYGYDTSGDLTEVFNSSGLPLRLTYDDDHRVTSWTDRNGTTFNYTYDPSGRVIRTTGTDGFLSATFTYDDTTRTTTFTNSLGHTSTYQHNDAYRLIRETDPLGNVTVREWDESNRLLVGVTDPLGRTTRFHYDEADNLAQLVHPDGSEIAIEYNELCLPTRVTGEMGQVWRHTYDERGNRLLTIDPAGARSEFAYDEAGAPVAVTDALGAEHRVTNNPAGLPIAITDPSGHTTRCVRDVFGRITSVVDPLGGETRQVWSADGKPVEHTLPDGSAELWEWDAEGNLVSHTEAGGGVTLFEITHFDLVSARTGPDGARIEFGYDTELRLTSVTDARGLTWTYDYDPAGRLTGERDFNGSTTHYAYDAAGQLTARTNSLAQTVHYAYDLLGNVTYQHGPHGAARFTYDRSGLLVRATNEDADLELVRDPLGRVLAEVCNGRKLASTYDRLGRRVERRTPTGVVSHWVWDAGGHPVSFTSAGHHVAFVHDGVGREVERVFGQEIRLRQTWNEMQQLTAQILTRPAQPADREARDGGQRRQTLRHRAFSYRPGGHLTLIDDHVGGERRFTLDSLSRVTEVTGTNWSERYAYDAAGDVAHASTPVRHDSDGDRVSSRGLLRRAGRVRYEYDAQGRVVLRQKTRLSRKPDTWRYVWDADDQLTEVTTPDGRVWRYLYDPMGRRVAKQQVAADGESLQEETRFTWDGTDLVEQTTWTDSGAEVVTLTWERDGVRPLAQTERRSLAEIPDHVVDERFFAIVTDLAGTPTELVSEFGDVAWQRDATLWGTPVDSQAYAADTPLRFPGQYFDPETQLHYNCFRYYDPSTALYTSPDPLGLTAGPNHRAYVPNPLEWIDYLGLASCTANADRLRKNMAREGRVVGPGQAAAHIVPSNGRNFRQWRWGKKSSDLLDRYGIDINDPANGIPLGHPKPHNFTHRGPFLQRLNARLVRVVEQGQADGLGARAIRTRLRQELRSIGRQIEHELATGRPGPSAYWTA